MDRSFVSNWFLYLAGFFSHVVCRESTNPYSLSRTHSLDMEQVSVWSWFWPWSLPDLSNLNV